MKRVRLKYAVVAALWVATATSVTGCPAKRPAASKPCLDVACLSRKLCSYDAARGCEVCVCEDTLLQKGEEPPPGQPPFPR